MYAHARKIGLSVLRSLNRTKSNSQIHSSFDCAKRNATSKHPTEKRVFQKREDRASQLHSKLENLMHKENHSATEQESRPIYRIFFASLLKKKAEMINVGAALVCTLLAYQLVAIKIRSRKLEEKLKLRDDELIERQALLKSLTESAFLDHLSDKCIERISNAPRGILWTRSKKSQDFMPDIESILKEEILQHIGDAGLSEEEKKKKVVTKLQEAQKELIQAASQQQTKQENMVGIQQKDPEILNAPSGEKIVKVTKFSI
mmetsp:Transcript_26074/g.38560  ORF Transcript_26074/g.38560 Transcript_26074/m.38560 type:complete len:260 (-) Transcript_26074:798-1577(-)|eukprot:CAMPEP_0194217872 /NCGR_PEP_ID=MMETSP0156-20130528/22438_1 /TAXON_ID=33649 /ORGANISM="Thalassionema nitzschioides, Strain L26-B" /LENGTH=259 /DNA_ID=CAMNT_0038947025 /DNA_START=190 /DNA_END=969 /DNA_ORIENTATION=-